MVFLKNTSWDQTRRVGGLFELCDLSILHWQAQLLQRDLARQIPDGLRRAAFVQKEAWDQIVYAWAWCRLFDPSGSVCLALAHSESGQVLGAAALVRLSETSQVWLTPGRAHHCREDWIGQTGADCGVPASRLRASCGTSALVSLLWRQAGDGPFDRLFNTLSAYWQLRRAASDLVRAFDRTIHDMLQTGGASASSPQTGTDCQARGWA